MDSENTVNQAAAKAAAAKTRGRIRGLWIGLAIWVFILLNALRVASFLTSSWIPWPIYALALLANLGIIAGTTIMLRNAYRELRGKPGSGGQA